MSKTGIFYASKGGVTEAFAKQIAEKLGADVYNMKDTKVDAIAGYQNVVLMSSNYFFGSLMEDWGKNVKLLHTVDFTSVWEVKNVIPIASVPALRTSMINSALAAPALSAMYAPADMNLRSPAWKEAEECLVCAWTRAMLK